MKPFFLISKLFFVVILAFLYALFVSKSIRAESLQWHLAYPILNGGNTEIRAATNDHVVYASNRKSDGSFDILKSTDSGQTWKSVKNNIPTGADANWISIQDSNSDIVAISVWGAGIYLSENGGESWTNIFNQNYPRSVAIDPVSSNIIFAGITDSNPGLYRTGDKGQNWQKMPLGNSNSVTLSIDQLNSGRVFADVGGAFFRSLDSGVTWSSPLPLTGGFSSSAFGSENINTVYATLENGIFKSTNNGNSWLQKTNGIGNAFFFRITQDDNGYLYVSIRGTPGGVWRSKDGAETWQNISDSSWSSTQTWGLDVKGGRIYVGVSGKGIYYADVNPEPTPVVFIPGFGGSWSYKGIVENQPTTYADWKLMPVFTDDFYQPLLSTLQNAGVSPFTFGFDFRKSVADSAASLNDYLGTVVGKKANVIGHSMGGLVARYCFEKVPGCADKINKIITAGTPHQGTIKAYLLWEAGQMENDDLWMKTVEEIALHGTSWPYLTDKDIIQNRFPGVHDLLPVSSPAPASAPFLAAITLLSGNTLQTYSGFSTTARSAMDKALGLWADGKPGTFTFALGDDTVLETSSEIAGSSQNKNYSLHHVDYLRTTNSLTDILNTFGLTASSIVTQTTSPSSVLAFIIHSPATITVNGQTDKAIFLKDPTNGNYQITVTGTGNGPYLLDAFYVSGGQTVHKTINGKITNGQTQTLNYNFNAAADQNFVDGSADLFLAAFRQKVAASSDRQLKLIEAQVVKAVKPVNFLALEKANVDIMTLLANQNSPIIRNDLLETANYLLELTAKLGQINGHTITSAQANTEITRTQKSLTSKQSKANLILREAANLKLAQELLPKAQALLFSGANYKALLQARGTNALLN